MKYADEQGRVRTLIVERYPFKGVENYFTDSLLYQDSLETDEKLQPEDPAWTMKRTQNYREKKNVFGK